MWRRHLSLKLLLLPNKQIRRLRHLLNLQLHPQLHHQCSHLLPLQGLMPIL
uniref:Pco142081 n=1 Tax=Arundo donax TaxID=35708 RepID=A0A0A9DX35_ARUDO